MARITGDHPAWNDLKSDLDRRLKKAPGLQYRVVDKDRVLFDYAGGSADIRNGKPMTSATTLMAYSMTKTLTAVAILRLAETGRLRLDDPIAAFLPECPYPAGITVRQLMTHTSGIPNPIPLRWVHPAGEQASFDERAALARVLAGHPKLSAEPGTRYAYSNIGYWLLGRIIEAATGAAYADDMKERIISPLGLRPAELGFIIPDPSRHAKGYLAKYSFLNLVKGFLTDPRVWGPYEGRWRRVNEHYVDGPSFGGLVGSAGAFGRFLQDQLSGSSVLLGEPFRKLLYTRQSDAKGRPIAMTLGWHIGDLGGSPYYFKEGGGGGFHGEMRVYPDRGFATVLMANATQFNSNRFLSRLDGHLLES